MASCRVPLDEQQVSDVSGAPARERTLPALHPERKEDRGFLPYTPPPEDDSAAQVEEYLEHAQFITEDLEWLLNLPHDKFWCQVVFDESLQRCLDSYLRLAPRGIDSSCLSLSPAVTSAQRRLHRSVFMVFLRMATHKESKENFITPAVFGEIIYDNFLFDIPKILDLCVLFGRGNAHLLHKMIENIFKQQPGYYGDLKETVTSIIQVFDTILEKCGLQSEECVSNQPLKLNTHTSVTAMTMREEEFSELLCYLCDTCSTIHAFLDIFPQASNTFHQHGFLNRLSSFYELAVPDMERAVRTRSFHTCVQEDLWRRLSHSSRRMVEIAHTVLQHTCLQPILEGADNTAAHVEAFLQTFTIILHERRFLADYDEVFPVAEDVSLLQQAFPHLDDTRTSYLLQGVHSAWESTGKKRPRPSPANRNKTGDESHWDSGSSHAEVAGKEEEPPGGAESMITVPRSGANGAVCSISEGELESLLSHIRDLLPDLGEGFLTSCLETYGYDSELVINNILEDRLTPELRQLDRALPRPVKEAQPTVLSSRSNAFDDDEFDVFSRDKVDMSRVWRGRRQGDSVRNMLNDKQHVEEQRERYRSYQTVVDEVPVATDPSGNHGNYYAGDEYDDEYDDTYSANQVGANDLDEDDELLHRRPFTTPRVLRGGRPEEEEEEEEEEGKEEEAVKRDHFLQDPALLRERAEARRAATQARRGYRPPPPSNVVGGAKGRGQTQETIQDRRRKETNKSRGANHNRRAMADRKRNKGMVPS